MENLQTLQSLAAQIDTDAAAAGQTAPHYQAYLYSGNDIGGINVGLLVNPARVTVSSVVQQGKDTTYTDPTNGQPAILNDRPPIVLQGSIGRPGSDIQKPITVVVNHLRSLNGIDDPTDGVRVRAKREAQAEYLANLIQSYQAASPSTYLISVGDYNANQFSDGYVDVMGCIRGNPVPADQVTVACPSGLVNPVLTDLIETIDPAQQYSYTFDGDAEAIDHILVNDSLLAKKTQMFYARNNADFPETYRNDITRPERNSDHDPDVAYFSLPPAEVTSGVQVTPRAKASNGEKTFFYVVTTVTNTGSATLTGPLQLVVVGLPAGITLSNATGSINGMPYIAIPSSTSVPPGKTRVVTLQFSDPASVRFEYTTRVFAGSF
jgi:predicted extracellular nuclease